MKHRAQTLSGEWVVGWYMQVRANVLDDNDIADYPIIHIIIVEFMDEHKILPETLSIETGKLDSNSEMIFGSFEVDGKMTTGGDVVSTPNFISGYDITYDKVFCSFFYGVEVELHGQIYGLDSDKLTIIGKQTEAVWSK